MLLTVGCSYTGLYYHSDPSDSYSIQLARHFGIGCTVLSTPGASAWTVYRSIRQYFADPVHGTPSFVFVQLPHSSRGEYWINNNSSHIHPQLNNTIVWADSDYRTEFTGAGRYSTGGTTATADSWSILDKHLLGTTVARAGSPGDLCVRSVDAKPRFVSVNHDRLYTEDASCMVQLHLAAEAIERFLDSTGVPYCYVESNYEVGDPYSSHFVDSELEQNDRVVDAYSYARLLCHKTHFVPRLGINSGSTTWCNDAYPCEHPGAHSHSQFTTELIPHIEKRWQ